MEKFESADLQSEKTSLEVKKLRLDIQTEWIKTVAIVASSISLVFTFALDRYKLNEQRNFEKIQNICKLKTDRMNALASISEKQLADTTSALVKNRSRTWLLITNVAVIRSKLNEMKSDDPEINDLKRYFDNVILQLQPAEASVDEWADAARVESLWRLQSGGFAPDFAILFGEDTKNTWNDTATKAVVALTAVYSLRGREEDTAVKNYRASAELLQSRILEKFKNESAACIK